MRTSFNFNPKIFVVLALPCLGLLSAAPAWAICTPSNDPKATVICTTNADKTCSQHGSTTMDGDGKNIIACLRNDSGTLEWKAMTTSSVSSAPQIRVVTAVKTDFRWPKVTASCAIDEVITGGGGSCTGGAGFNFVVHSKPNGNGWYISCDTPESQNVKATAYALCAKK